MLRRARLLSLALVLTGGLAAGLVAGCGGSSSDDGGAAAGQFDTLDGMVAFYDTNTASGPSVMPRALVNRIHAETPIQEDLVGMLRDMLPTDDLVVAVRERFGAELFEDGDFSTETNSPLTLTTVEEARAEGTTTDPAGEEQTVHFVRIGDEWWISGYTLEYAVLEGAPEGMTPEQMVEMSRSMMGPVSEAAADVQRRLDAGEFSDVEQVRTAYNQAIMQGASRNFTSPGG